MVGESQNLEINQIEKSIAKIGLKMAMICARVKKNESEF